MKYIILFKRNFLIKFKRFKISLRTAIVKKDIFIIIVIRIVGIFVTEFFRAAIITIITITAITITAAAITIK